MRKFEKEIFSRTSRPISFKVGAHHTWAKGSQVSSNKRPGPLQRENNHKHAKIGCGHLKIFCSRTTGLEKLRFI
jgi:hypothetical protein